MSRTLMMLALAGALAALGCEQKTEAPAPGAAPPAKGQEQAKAPSATAEELPTEQDFEEEAEKEITADNLTGELDKLEKEIQ